MVLGLNSRCQNGIHIYYLSPAVQRCNDIPIIMSTPRTQMLVSRYQFLLGNQASGETIVPVGRHSLPLEHLVSETKGVLMGRQEHAE